MRKWIWRSVGLLFVGCAYIGAIVPGIPTTTFLVLALWCFAKSSPELHSCCTTILNLDHTFKIGQIKEFIQREQSTLCWVVVQPVTHGCYILV